MALTPEEEAELKRIEAELEAEESAAEQRAATLPDPERDSGTTLAGVGRSALRTLDALGAPVRGAVSKAIGGVQSLGDAPLLPEGDIGDILAASGRSLKETLIDPIRGVSEAPTAGDIREQLGVQKEDLSIPLPVDVPGIGQSLELAPTVDTLSGAALDPLTAAGTPVAGALRGTGRNISRSAFKGVDSDIAGRGARPFSELAEQRGLTGSAEKVLDKTADLQKALGAERKAVFKEADRVGAKTSLGNVFRDAEQAAKEVADTNPKLSKRLLKEIEDLRKQHSPTKDPKVLNRLSLEETTKLKTQFQNSLPESAFDTLPGGEKVPKQGAQRVIDTLQKGLRREVERAGNKALPGLGTEVADINRQFQTVRAAVGRSGKGPLSKQAKREANKKSFSAVDQILAGLGLGGAAFGNPAAALALTAKKAGDIAGTSGGRQAIGGAFQRLADVPGLDTVLRRGIIDANQ